MEHHQTVVRPHNGTPGWWATVWCASTNFSLQILILKQNQIFKISYFHIYLKITKKFTKVPKTQIFGMSVEILVCLKRTRDICLKTIMPRQNTSFM